MRPSVSPPLRDPEHERLVATNYMSALGVGLDDLHDDAFLVVPK